MIGQLERLRFFSHMNSGQKKPGPKRFRLKGADQKGRGPTAIDHKTLDLVQAVICQIERGSMEMRLPDGSEFRAEGRVAGPTGKLQINHPSFYRRLIVGGEVAFGEMFMDGWWSSPDLQDLLDVILMNNENLARKLPGTGLFRLRERVRHLMRNNSKTGSQRNIAHHYDLGNQFYSLWLDESLTYSSALFCSNRESLGQAQRNKYAAICDRLAISPGDQILEIGCGWGGFAEFAARERGAHITALTISREQQKFAQQRLFSVGLADRVKVCLRDYRDETGTYDGIVSIEMIEAVGEKYWPLFFASLRARLRPNCRAALQAITIADRLFPQYRQGADFIQKYIFPGGMLLSPDSLVKQGRAAGLRVVEKQSLADSYSRTLRVWRQQFNASWEQISILGFDNRFKRMWNFYLAASAAGFAAGTTDVAQITYHRK